MSLKAMMIGLTTRTPILNIQINTAKTTKRGEKKRRVITTQIASMMRKGVVVVAVIVPRLHLHRLERFPSRPSLHNHHHHHHQQHQQQQQRNCQVEECLLLRYRPALVLPAHVQEGEGLLLRLLPV